MLHQTHQTPRRLQLRILRTLLDSMRPSNNDMFDNGQHGKADGFELSGAMTAKHMLAQQQTGWVRNTAAAKPPHMHILGCKLADSKVFVRGAQSRECAPVMTKIKAMT